MPKQTVVVALRHVERQKKNEADPQMPTEGGELVAYAMGARFRQQGWKFDRVISSPQPRARRTAEVFLRGLAPLDSTTVTTEITDDIRLDDFSSDKRDVVAIGLKSAKIFAKQHGLEPEQAIFLDAAGKAALELKTSEFLAVVDQLGEFEGVYLMACHGGSIDDACAKLQKRLNPSTLDGMGANGGIFGKVEGFIATFEDGVIVKVEIVRVPDYIPTLLTVVK